MILLLCRHCMEGVTVSRRARRRCPCGRASGKIVDDKLVVTPDTLPIGITNSSVQLGLSDQPAEGWGRIVEALVMPRDQYTEEKLDESDESVSAPTDGKRHDAGGILPRPSRDRES